MKEGLSYHKFGKLSIGDALESVAEIDPITVLYQQNFDTASDAALINYSKRGAPPTSVHLLTDGILKIEYKRVEGKYIIINIEYNKDFILDGLNGKTCYKIADVDYLTTTK